MGDDQQGERGHGQGNAAEPNEREAHDEGDERGESAGDDRRGQAWQMQILEQGRQLKQDMFLLRRHGEDGRTIAA